jgi:hypothetical protein
MKKTKKIILSCIAVLLLWIIGYYAHYFIYYVGYDEYKSSLKNYEYETGVDFLGIEDSDKSIPDMVLVAENNNLKLYTNTETTEVAIYDKRSGEVTYSNPIDRGNDSKALGVHKSFLSSQLIVDYYNAARSSGTWNNYDMSIANDQFQVESIENGIRYIYTLGDLSSPTGIVPIYITEERLQIYLDNMEAKDARNVKGKYKDSETIPGFLELSSGAQKKATLKKLNDFFADAGYTEEDYQADKAAASGEEAEIVTFKIPLEYRLTADGIEVSVPTEQIEETGGAKIYNIQLLRYFGAAGLEEEGYMVVPNGSGSIINFNNGKTTAPEYNQYVYGMDPMVNDYTVVENTENARLPVFGIKKEDSAVLVSIENGDSLANIIADISNKVNSYNYVYPSFLLRGAEKLDMFGASGQESELPVVEKDIYGLDIKVRYTMLTKDNASYSGMANYYRERLIAEGVLTPNEKSDSIPFYVDVIGGVKQTAYILGVPYLQVYPMTTFEEAGIIADNLNALDIKNLRVNYQGWFNGGYYHDVPNKINGLGKIGGKDDLEDLTEQIEAEGGKVYADVAFQEVTYITKRFRYEVESSRYYAGGYVASFGQVNPITLRKTSSLGYVENLYNLVSPKFLPRYVSEFAERIGDYNVTGVSLRDLGDALHSDKKRTNVINREDSKNVVIDQFEKLDEVGKDIMVDGGNYYALKYIDDIINMPLSHNPYYLIDEEIPFYQMIVHGTIDYTGASINLSDSYDITDNVLRLLEYGAAPHFTFTYEDSSEIKYSGINRMYSTQFDKWMEEVNVLYHELNGVLKHVTGSVIVEHEILAPGVKKISYDNGVIILINTNKNAVEVNGVKLPARSYVTEGVK